MLIVYRVITLKIQNLLQGMSIYIYEGFKLIELYGLKCECLEDKTTCITDITLTKQLDKVSIDADNNFVNKWQKYLEYLNTIKATFWYIIRKDSIANKIKTL